MSVGLLNNNRYDKYIFALIISLAFGVWGGALMVVRVLAILLLPALISKYKFCSYYTHKYRLVLLLFYFFCLCSLLWTVDIKEGLKELAYYLVHFIIFFEILVFAKFANNPLRTISRSWLFCVSITLIIAIWELTTNNHLMLTTFDSEDQVINFGGVKVDRPFASVTFGNLNGYVTFLCFAMPFLYYNLINSKNAKSLFFPLIILVVSVIVILANASRGGLLSTVIMAGVFLFLSKRKNKSLIFIILLFVGLFVYYYVVPRLDSIFLVLSLKSGDGGLFEDYSRMEIWKVAISVFVDYLFIGSGVGSIIAAMKLQSSGVLPITHNMFIELLVQYGVFFFAVFVLYLFRLYKRAQITQDRSIKTIVYLSLFALPVYSIIDSGYLLNPIVYMAFASITVYANISIIKPDYNEKNN